MPKSTVSVVPALTSVTTVSAAVPMQVRSPGRSRPATVPWRPTVAALLLAALTACGGNSGDAGGGSTGNGGATGTGSGGSIGAISDTGNTDGTQPGGGFGTSVDSCVKALPIAPELARPVASSNIAFEPVATGRLWAVNPDNNSVSLIDAVSANRLAEITVGLAPRTLAIAEGGDVWVVNRDSASISVIDPVTLTVSRTIALPAASQPWGIVFSPENGSAWITLQASGELIRLGPDGGRVCDRIALAANVRHLSMPSTGDRILVSRFISPPLPDEASATPKASVEGVDHGGEVLLVDPNSRTVTGKVVLTVSDRSDTSLQGRGIPNYLGAPAISPDGRSAWVPSKQDNVMRGSYRDGQPIDYQNTVRAISSRVVLDGTPIEDNFLRVDHDNSGVASASVFDPTGRFLFVALETSREVALVDPVNGRDVTRLAAGFAPQGVAVSDDGRWLAVNNVMSRSVGLFDLLDLDSLDAPVIHRIGEVGTVVQEKLAANLLRGKQLFYDARDPRLARDSYISCASCHNDGDGDGRVWDLSSMGEGLRNTIPLTGRAGGELALHWSGNFDEIQDFEIQIRNLGQGTGLMSEADYRTGNRSEPLGAPKAGVSADLDALAAYVQSLDRHAPSPYRNADRSLSPGAVTGRQLFADKGCGSCHFGAGFSGNGGARHDIGTIKASSGQRLAGTLDGIDTPTLRDVWASAPYLHDGSAATLADAISAHNTGALTATEVARLVDYVQQIGSEE